jgi:hypothetical protein
MLNVVDPVVFAPAAVTVYEAEAANTVGVPEMTPVEEFRIKPAGSVGLTVYAFAVPLRTGLSAVIATLLV